MRIVPFLIAGLLTAGLVTVFNMQLPVGATKTPRLGYFLSPQHGFWQNAEPVNTDFDSEVQLPELKGKVDVYMDERLVPHIYAANDLDAYYVQGFLHAKFRLWQMEFQTHVAAGRLSEIVGEERVATDRFFRRLGEFARSPPGALSPPSLAPAVSASPATAAPPLPPTPFPAGSLWDPMAASTSPTMATAAPTATNVSAASLPPA